MVVDDFDVVLTKRVGDETYTFLTLTDAGSLASCFNHVVLSLPLDVTDIEGGEYTLTIDNDGVEIYSCLVLVTDQSYDNPLTGGSVYANTITQTNL